MAADAVRVAQRRAPVRDASYRVEIQFNGTAIAEVAEGLPLIERPAPDTLAFTAQTMPQAYRLIRILYRYVNPD
jgi:D-amino peptidase